MKGTATAEPIFGGDTCSTAGMLITCHFDSVAFMIVRRRRTRFVA
jgi:hypothetical protein